MRNANGGTDIRTFTMVSFLFKNLSRKKQFESKLFYDLTSCSFSDGINADVNSSAAVDKA